MDIFYEKNLNSDSIDRHKKRAIVIRVIRILCIVLIVGVVLIVPNAIELPGEGADCGQLLLSLLISMVLFLIPPILTYVLLGRLSARQNVEYDYHILGDTFRIIKVIHRKKRKKYLEFPVSAISSLGLAESENFTRFSADKTNKKHFVFCNEDAEVLLYALVNANNGRQLLVLEGDNEFLQALRKAIKSYSALDDSLKQYLQKINR
ncbi:MAG: hypothetical protein LBH24_05485, partial [Clostridiales bacterium]|nr:hypothetical protein [Clostridiales bacterium]